MTTTVRRIEPANLMVGAAVSMFEGCVVSRWRRRDSGILSRLHGVDRVQLSRRNTLIYCSRAGILFGQQSQSLTWCGRVYWGCGGGVAQAYLSMGVCTTMKTAEITRSKQSIRSLTTPTNSKGTMGLFIDILKKLKSRGP
ncbi:hypothetical protein KEM48_003685 [Puccinia striiformis f. sp. tritici PST-130]|nr:hypothetical protein KEM48_003685 [Puccinia striiformis f. sp. tritici PST-130]